MGAECRVHGVDLHGNEWSEGGLVCPVCEREQRLERLSQVVGNVAAELHDLSGALLYDEEMEDMKIHAEEMVDLAMRLERAIGSREAEPQDEPKEER